MNKIRVNNKIKHILERPKHKKDIGQAHIKFGQDPKPNLQKYGYCVVEDVFDKTTCNETISEMWKWLESLNTGIKQNDISTWSDIHWPVHLRAGMLQHTLGQEEFMWKIREHKNVVHVFSQVHATEKLLTSFDGASINRPINSGFAKESNESWLHTDQNVINDIAIEDVYTSNKYSIQGVANFADVGDNDGSLFVSECSHLLHSKLFAWNKTEPRGNWYILKGSDIDFLKDNGIEFVKVNAPAGSLLLFDSRCFHSGCSSVGKNNDKFRYVIYVSQSPAKRATESDIKLKVKAVHNGLTTSHWSSCNIKIFNKPRHSNDAAYLTREQNIPNYATWSLDRKKLAGLLSY